ncbi:hypothetical protein [Pseudomonas sp. 1152_12]|uniref:hypothetical protein n=1 Tax=Pseudomonas sp. 1152_12 TaxID=2604455 RepID=UPI004062A074
MHGISPYYGSSHAAFSGLPGVIGRFGESHPFPTDDTPAWKKLGVYKTFSEALARDTALGVLTTGGKELLDAAVSPNPSIGPRVTVSNFNVGPHYAKDMFFVKREPIEPDKVNFVLYMPEQNFTSNYAFNSYQEIDSFLKGLARKPDALNAFLAHFGDKTESAAVRASILELASTPQGSPPKVLTGPGKQIPGNVFEHLDRSSENPTTFIYVNGLVNQQLESIDSDRPTYSGVRPDGEKVVYRYDRNGHLLGSGDKGNFYFLINGANSKLPLVPITLAQLRVIAFGDPLALYTHTLANFLEHPFSGVSTLLQALGVDKGTADTVEQGLDNPVTAVLVFLNKNNDIGRVFGLPKREMDEALSYFGSAAQGFVPTYGTYRTVAAVLAKIIRHVPVTEEEAREAANGLGVKADLNFLRT